jgi:hypothetical protein
MTSTLVAGTYQSGEGLLVALNIDGSVRMLALDPDGAATELLNETEYQKNWPFDPDTVFALRRSDGVDVLVTDHTDAAFIHKQGTATTLTALGTTTVMDLEVLGFAPTTSGTLAMYTKASSFTVLDTATMQKTPRPPRGDGGFLVVPHSTGAWLTAERLDLATDCQDTGEVMTCGGGEPSVPRYACTWHVDVWNVKDTSFIDAEPLVTFDLPATISPYCGDDTPAGLATLRSDVGFGFGIGRHHAATLDQRTQGLALAFQYPQPSGTAGIALALIDQAGTRIIDRTTAALTATNGDSWLAVRADRLFMCGRTDCAMSDATTATAFRLPYEVGGTAVGARGVTLTPNGVRLIGTVNGNPLMSQLLNCTH